MKKMELKDRVARAYFVATGQSDGWEKFPEHVRNGTQEEGARVYGVTTRTFASWVKQYRELQAA